MAAGILGIVTAIASFVSLVLHKRGVAAAEDLDEVVRLLKLMLPHLESSSDPEARKLASSIRERLN